MREEERTIDMTQCAEQQKEQQQQQDTDNKVKERISTINVGNSKGTTSQCGHLRCYYCSCYY